MPTPTGKTTRPNAKRNHSREVAEQIAADRGGFGRSPYGIPTSRPAKPKSGTSVRLGAGVPVSACARRKRSIRRARCEEGRHLTQGPTVRACEPSEVQRARVERRVMITAEDRLDEVADALGSTRAAHLARLAEPEAA